MLLLSYRILFLVAIQDYNSETISSTLQHFCGQVINCFICLKYLFITQCKLCIYAFHITYNPQEGDWDLPLDIIVSFHYFSLFSLLFSLFCCFSFFISQIIFKNLTTLQLDLTSKNLNLTGATYLEIIREVSLHYVDLGKGCE